MQPLNGSINYQKRFNRDGTIFSSTPYTLAEAKTALHTHREEVFRYELHRLTVGVGWSIVADITQLMQSCTLKYNGHGENFMGSADMVIVDDANLINWQTDAVRVWHMLKMPDGHYIQWMKGTFYVPSPKQELKFGAVRKVDTRDALQVLYEDKITDWFKVPSVPPSPYTFDPGDPLGWAREFIAVQYPFAGIDISPDTTIRVGDDPPPAPTRNRSKIYEVGTPRLDVINSLLLFCNYDILRADETGSLISHPFVKPSLRPVEYAYVADNLSIIVRESGESEQDLWNAPNQWLRVVTRPDAPLLRSRLTLTDPTNPLSTTYRGRTVTDYAQIDAPDQATLDTVVQALYEDGQRILKKLKMNTPLMPHAHNDKVTVQWTTAHPWAGVANGVYTIYGWTFPCVPGGQMELELELVPFSPALPVPPATGTYFFGGYGYYVNGVFTYIPLTVHDQETGIGTESVSVAVQRTATDSGAGTEAIIQTGKVDVSDSGSGSESVVRTIDVRPSDSGVGSESTTSPGSVSASNSGAGTESVVVSAQTTATDSGAGTETPVQTVYLHAPNAIGTVGADNTDGFPFSNGKPHIFVMSDGARVVLYFNGTNYGYRIKPSGGSWGSFTQLSSNPTWNPGLWTRNGDTIYGARTSPTTSTACVISKLTYSSGSISESHANQVYVDVANFITGVYWDNTNSLLHITSGHQAVQGFSWADMLESYNSSLSRQAASFLVSGISNGAAVFNGKQVAIWGDGGSTFYIAEKSTQSTTTPFIWKVTYSGGHSITAQSGIPAATSFDACYGMHDGTNVDLYVCDGATIKYIRRVSDSNWGSYTTLISSGAESSAAPVIGMTKVGSDLVLFYRRTAGQANGEIYFIVRLGGTWDASPGTLFEGGSSGGWREPAPQADDTNLSSRAMVVYATGTVNPFTIKEGVLS